MSKKEVKIALNIEATALCHATENIEKVRAAILNIVPEELRQESEKWMSALMLEGFYGNPISLLRLTIDRAEMASKLFSYIIKNLDHEDFSKLNSTLYDRLDSSGNLYIRLDKQSAYRGRLKLYEGDDVIKIRIKLSRQFLNEIADKGINIENIEMH